ncbi:MAG TPA: FAD-binding domain-containing protein [Chitinophagaceae bacterium]|nr:FAD-binding domain-containing protein [Chitinophagaceae bacterium]
MESKFETGYNSIWAKLDEIDPVKYGRTRNYVDGAVTYLSPYISRGVISTKQVLQFVLAKGYKLSEIEYFVKELCWRDYFQRVGQVKDLDKEIKHPQTNISSYEIPSQVLDATTGITAIDEAINGLYQYGYMHNHCRMYVASLVCNIAKSYWYHPAQWLYYHLLDGDWASNACNWQWVAGANSNKKYYANQENINKYTHTNQVNSFLDKPYEAFETLVAPASLLETRTFSPEMELPQTPGIQAASGLPTFIYNYYNLDPLWHKDEPGNRVLLLEPHFFAKYPVSKKCLEFILALSKNIPGIQVYAGSFQSLCENYGIDNCYYKEHPFNTGYEGKRDERDWIAEEVSGYYPSFFTYWKKVRKCLYK